MATERKKKDIKKPKNPFKAKDIRLNPSKYVEHLEKNNLDNISKPETKKKFGHI